MAKIVHISIILEQEAGSGQGKSKVVSQSSGLEGEPVPGNDAPSDIPPFNPRWC